jgi:hypothetical protein
MHLELNALTTKGPRTLATRQKPVLMFTLWFLPKDLIVRVEGRVGGGWNLGKGWNLRSHPPILPHKQFVS